MALMGVSKPLQTWPKGGVGAATAGAAGAAAAGGTAEAGVLPRLRLVATAAAEVAAVMECEGTVAEIGRTVHPHPTVSEAVMEAAHVSHGTCVNAPKPRK